MKSIFRVIEPNKIANFFYLFIIIFFKYIKRSNNYTKISTRTINAICKRFDF